jgi:hypothetical protein
LSADGRVVAIGAEGNSENGFYSGHVRVYEWNSITWIQLGEDIDGREIFDLSGHSVSISADGKVVAIGAPGNGAGHVHVYEWNAIAWIQLGDDIDGESVCDAAGSSVSLSADGRVVAIGTNGSADHPSGTVCIYEWDGTVWNKLGRDIVGEAAGDAFGSSSVSVSADGQVLAIGANFNDGKGFYAGHVRIYELQPDMPSFMPSYIPSGEPSVSMVPTAQPTLTMIPSVQPSVSMTPSEQPTLTMMPSWQPSVSMMPSGQPTLTMMPSWQPSVSMMPSEQPTLTMMPSWQPSVSMMPSGQPTLTMIPSGQPSVSMTPSGQPTLTVIPSWQPSVSMMPSGQPTLTMMPSGQPSVSMMPSGQPTLTMMPSGQPSVSMMPSGQPTLTMIPSGQPSVSMMPSGQPTLTMIPSWQPSVSMMPSGQPTLTMIPSGQPSVSMMPSISNLPSSNPTYKPTPHRLTRKPTHTPSRSPSLSPPPPPTKPPVKMPVTFQSYFASGSICGGCIISSDIETVYNSLDFDGIVHVGSIQCTSFCNLSLNGLINSNSAKTGTAEGVQFVLEFILTATNPEDILEPSKVLEFFNSRSEVISATMSQILGTDITIQDSLREIEAPSASPTQSAVPTISMIPSGSHSPTQKYQPSVSPESTHNPSYSPTTASSKTIRILSTFQFDDSGRNFCLNAMKFTVGSKIKMRPCKDNFAKQKWFMDEFNQMHLIKYPNLCMVHNKRDIVIGTCNHSNRTMRNKSRFQHDRVKGLFYVKKKKRVLYLGVDAGHKYGPVKLFLESEQNESLNKWMIL